VSDIPIHEMTSEQATAKLAELQAAYDARTAPPAPPEKPTTASEAKARLDHLTANKEWGKKLEAGSADEVREFKELTAMVASTDPEARLERVLAGEVHNNTMIETVSERELSTSKLAIAVDDLKSRGFSPKAIREIFTGEKMSPEHVAAAAHLKERALRDPAFTKAYLAAEPDAVEAMTLWNAIIVGGVKED
jgi:hypothetical protein